MKLVVIKKLVESKRKKSGPRAGIPDYIKERVLTHVKRGDRSITEISEITNISHTSIHKWINDRKKRDEENAKVQKTVAKKENHAKPEVKVEEKVIPEPQTDNKKQKDLISRTLDSLYKEKEAIKDVAEKVRDLKLSDATKDDIMSKVDKNQANIDIMLKARAVVDSLTK